MKGVPILHGSVIVVLDFYLFIFILEKLTDIATQQVTVLHNA